MGEASPVYRVGPGNPPIETRFGGPRGPSPGLAGAALKLMYELRTSFDLKTVLVPKLTELLNHASYKAQVAAIQIILERGWGKPPQMLESEDAGPLPLTEAEIAVVKGIYAGALKRGSGEVGAPGSPPSAEPQPDRPQ